MTQKSKQTRKNIIFWVIPAAIALIAIGTLAWSEYKTTKPEIANAPEIYQKKSNALKQYLADEILNNAEKYKNPETGKYTVIMSSSNGQFRPFVFPGTAEDITSAWAIADKRITSALNSSTVAPRWVKCDIIYHAEKSTINPGITEKIIEYSAPGTCHYGLAFDDNFDTAILEQEINAFRIYDYENASLNRDYLQQYMEAARNLQINTNNSPILFMCQAWLCDDDGQIYELESTGLNYGRRKIETISDEYITNIIAISERYLLNEMQDNGQFTYQYYPQHEMATDDYNTHRHAGTLWAMSQIYETTGNPAIQEHIKSGIDWLYTQTDFKDNDTAFIYAYDEGTYNAGVAGLTLLAITGYQGVFQDNAYENFAKAIGNGLIQTQNQETGQLTHELNPDMTVSEQFATVYYDGESMLGLCKLYQLTHDEKYLKAANKIMTYAIANDYGQYADHWLAYSANELTRIQPDRAEYYDIMFKNLEGLMDAANRSKYPSPYLLEALMNSFECIQRAKSNGISIPDTYDEQELLTTIQRRVNRQLSNFYFPEKAMYTPDAERILNTFYDDDKDAQSIRIDDIQHNIGGLYLYAKLYDQLT